MLFNPYNFASRLDYQQCSDKETKTHILSKLLEVNYPGSSRVMSPIPLNYFIAPLTHIAQIFLHLSPEPQERENKGGDGK